MGFCLFVFEDLNHEEFIVVLQRRKLNHECLDFLYVHTKNEYIILNIKGNKTMWKYRHKEKMEIISNSTKNDGVNLLLYIFIVSNK